MLNSGPIEFCYSFCICPRPFRLPLPFHLHSTAITEASASAARPPDSPDSPAARRVRGAPDDGTDP